MELELVPGKMFAIMETGPLDSLSTSSPPPVCNASTEAELKNRVIQYTEKQMDYSLDLYTYRVSYMVSGADGVDTRKETGTSESETEENQKTRRNEKVGGEDVCYASLDLPSRGQKPLKKKKRRVESSELSTYSESMGTEIKVVQGQSWTGGVLISSTSGLVVEMRVKPGHNATIYCDCTYQSKFIIAWIIKPSNEHQPPLIRLTEDTTPPRYSRVWNYTKGTYDLLVKNITESDLGLYYCALTVKGNTSGGRLPDVYHEGNRTTFLSFLGESVHSDLLVLLIWIQQFLVQIHPRPPPPSKPPPRPLLYQTVVSAGSCWSVRVLHVFSSPQSSPPPVCTVSTEAELK
ncbi:hypothetical protein NFI96_026645, partial [Prochilodus magdalenae]